MDFYFMFTCKSSQRQKNLKLQFCKVLYLDRDQEPHFVVPDLRPTYFQRLSTEKKNHH